MKNITQNLKPILQAKGLMKRYGTVVAMNGADFDLYPNEVLGVIGDNGAGKTTLIRAISGATIPDHGVIELDGKVVNFNTPDDARNAGIETVYQNLALSPALSIADNMFLGREIREKGNDVRDDVRVHRDGERDEEPLHIRRDARGDIRIHGIQPQVDRSAHDGARDGVRDEHVQEETPSANLAHPLVLKHVHQEVRGTTAKVVNTHRGGNKVRADQNGCGGRQAVRKLLRLSHFAEEVGIDALSTVRNQNAR